MYKWFEEGGHIFSEETKTIKSQDFRLGNTFQHRVAIAFNVGGRLARQIVDEHNKFVESKQV